MTIRTKAICLTAAILASTTLLMSIVSRQILKKSFIALEKQQMRHKIATAKSAIGSRVDIIDALCSEWTRRPSVQRCISEKERVSEEHECIASRRSLLNFGINFVVFADKDFEWIAGNAIDLGSGLEMPLQKGVENWLRREGNTNSQSAILRGASGAMVFPETPALVSLHPVPATADGQDPGGYLLVGQYLDTTTVNDLAHESYAKGLSLMSVESGSLSPESIEAVSELQAGLSNVFRADSDDSASVYSLFTDIHKAPALVLRVDDRRYTYLEGKAAIRYFFILMLASGAVVSVAVFMILERLILLRLQHIEKKVDSIGDQADSHIRMLVEGNDEISHVALSLNKMLDRLADFQQALRKSESLFSTIFHSSPNPMMILRPDDFTVEDANSMMLELLEFGRGEMIGKSLSELNIMAAPQDLKDIESQISEKGKMRLQEAGLRSKSGKLRDVIFSADKINLDRGEYIVFSAIDITSRKKLDSEMQKIEKLEALGNLAGGIAHDFNNIVTAIMANISIARSEGAEGHKYREMLEDAEEACIRARELTNQLLTFARGGAPVKRIESIDKLIADCSDFVLRGSNVKAEYTLPENLWAVEVDAGQISQVINNLVINAKEAMPGGGTLKIRAENIFVDQSGPVSLDEGKYIRIDIEDEGVGIPQKYLARIFEPYFTTKQEGSGLGLASSYSIVKRHGGLLSVRSTPDSGTTFSVYLPSVGMVLENREKKDRIKTDIASKKILVMDDEESICKIAAYGLSKRGHKVDTAKDGEVAIEMYCKAMESGAAYDLLIMDLTIPGGVGGKEAISKLRAIDPDVKAIVSSGYADDPVITEHKEHGFCGIAQKPYSINELCASIEKIFDREEA